MNRSEMQFKETEVYQILESLDKDLIVYNIGSKSRINRVKAIVHEFYEVLDKTWLSMSTMNDNIVAQKPEEKSYGMAMLKTVRDQLATCFNEENYFKN